MRRSTAEPVQALAVRLDVSPPRPMATRTKVVLAAEILLVYVRVRWLMRRRDVRTIVSTVRTPSRERPDGAGPEGLDDRHVALRLGSAVRRTLTVLPTDSRCLVQALVLSRLLSARTIPSTLVIGVRPEPSFDAHAWVEHDGLPVLSPQGFDALRLVEI